MKTNTPRFMLAAPGSGSGKTLITCGLLQLLVNRGYRVSSFKCGPDFIDPMFHEKVIGTRAKNLDTFFTDRETTRYLFHSQAETGDISVIEGVMGYYDGLAGISTEASSYALADTLEAPVVLIVPCKGMSVSVLAMLKGYLTYQPDSRIKGVIFNQLAPGLYPEIKAMAEEMFPVKCLGYVPRVPQLALQSRHLGLVMPDEIAGLKDKLNELAGILEETLDIPALLALAEEAEPLAVKAPVLPDNGLEGIPVGIARDEAFCFTYQDNIELLIKMGAKPVYFSPLKDQQLPQGIQGLVLSGGYPELYAGQLAENKGMLTSIREALEQQMPCIAECGGFLYLHQQLEDTAGKTHQMVGFLPEQGFWQDKLGRFGYIELEAEKDQLLLAAGEKIRGHEFHYWESTAPGTDCLARKPLRKRSWSCVHGNAHLFAGFPHLYYYGNPDVPDRFLRAASNYTQEEAI